MRTRRTLAEQSLGLVSGFAIASVLFLAAFVLAFTSGHVLATHDTSGNVHACVSVYTGKPRIMRPGQAPTCSTSEFLMEWPGSTAFGDLEARLQALEEQVPDCLATEGDDALFEGCNVHVRNGQGGTQTTNGSGNLIVGYNEGAGDANRDGSHNLVVGAEHGYSSYGGLVIGQRNQISGPFSSVSGGQDNTASGPSSSISGGNFNFASGENSIVSGGNSNSASGDQSSIGGGIGNSAGGNLSSVSGGNSNNASGPWSSVSGGIGNEASGPASSVSGGFENTASGGWSSVSGGANRATDSADPDFDWRGGSLIEDS